MNKPKTIITLLVALSFITTMYAVPEERDLINGNTQFGTLLLQELSKSNDGNILFSPLNIHSLLSLIYQGSEGNTRETLARVLNIPEAKEESAQGYKEIMSNLNRVNNVTLHIANKIFMKDSLNLRPPFQSLAKDNFFSETDKLNFGNPQETSAAINAWVETKTNQRIKDLIQPDMIDPLSAMILVNAIYFKGNWEKQFSKELTQKEKFHVSPTQTVDVDMMHVESNFRYGENRELDVKILELPYENKQISMFVILPNKIDGIKELEQKLGSIRLSISELFRSMTETEASVALPKFKIESTIILNDILKNIGLEVIFSDEADFSGLLEDPVPVKVGEAIQKAYLEVNEEGAEAAAGGGIGLLVDARPSPVNEFIVDHPFVIILQVQNSIMFMGSIHTPSL